MSKFQRFKNLFSGVLILLAALVLFLAPEESYELIAYVLAIGLLVYGFRLLWYYFTMARHMVGGKRSLYQAIIILDLGLFAGSITSVGTMYILLYLLAVYAFTGAVDVLRALEQRKLSAPSWMFKLVGGVMTLVLALTITVVSLVTSSKEFMVYGYCASLLYTAAMRIVSAFRRTSIVYIQ